MQRSSMRESSTQIVHRSLNNSSEDVLSLEREPSGSPDRFKAFMSKTTSRKVMEEINFSGKPWSNAGESQLINSFAQPPRNEVNTLCRASELSLIEIKIKPEP